MSSSDLAVAVVGAGPAGIFATEALLARHPRARVDVLDRGLTPYGLVRYGVAPDHDKIKTVTRVLAKTLTTPGVRYFGNVRVGDPAEGADVDLTELRARYHAVIVATGAPCGIRLDVPGGALPGSLTAADVVPWYNGHPDAAAPPVPARSVVVVGAGNVALDIARVLLKGSQGLAGTDVPPRVHATLRALATTDVHLVIRRGPADVRFGMTELRGMEQVAGIGFAVDATALDAAVPDHGPAALLTSWATRSAPAAPRRLHLHFHRVVSRVEGQRRVSAVTLEPTRQTAAGRGSQMLAADLVVAAIGYRSEPLPGLPFDPDSGRIPNDDGRIELGCYVVGWAKRGPHGVIGVNKRDAADTVMALLADGAALSRRRLLADDLADLLSRRRVPAVTWQQWQRLDAAETAQGTPRLKLDSRAHMLAAMRAGDRDVMPRCTADPGTHQLEPVFA